MRQGEEVRFVHSIEHGLCKMLLHRSGAGPFLFALRGVGSLVGAEVALGGGRAAFTAVTLTACRLSTIPADALRELVRTSPEFSWQLHRRLSRELVSATTRVAELASLTARDRLVKFLEGVRSGEFAATAGGSLRPFPLKQWEIAQYLGIAPQHLSLLLRGLEREGSLGDLADVLRRRHPRARDMVPHGV
jgi:CRP-like cAMP-binding protein